MSTKAPVCPYCGSVAMLVDTSRIYGRGHNYGMAWVCGRFPDCDSYVGCHRGTDRPLGRLADKELRDAKRLAHDHFDRVWQRMGSRKEGYRWLAEQMGLAPQDCHIGMFDVDQCQQVVQLSAACLKE